MKDVFVVNLLKGCDKSINAFCLGTKFDKNWIERPLVY